MGPGSLSCKGKLQNQVTHPCMLLQNILSYNSFSVERFLSKSSLPCQMYWNAKFVWKMSLEVTSCQPYLTNPTIRTLPCSMISKGNTPKQIENNMAHFGGCWWLRETRSIFWLRKFTSCSEWKLCWTTSVQPGWMLLFTNHSSIFSLWSLTIPFLQPIGVKNFTDTMIFHGTLSGVSFGFQAHLSKLFIYPEVETWIWQHMCERCLASGFLCVFFILCALGLTLSNEKSFTVPQILLSLIILWDTSFSGWHRAMSETKIHIYWLPWNIILCWNITRNDVECIV